MLQDIRYIRHMLPILRMLSNLESSGTLLIELFERAVTQYQDKTFLIFEDNKFTYRFVYSLSVNEVLLNQ